MSNEEELPQPATTIAAAHRSAEVAFMKHPLEMIRSSPGTDVIAVCPSCGLVATAALGDPFRRRAAQRRTMALATKESPGRSAYDASRWGAKARATTEARRTPAQRR